MTGDTRAQLDDIVRFHGHMCPGLAVGVRAGEIALREIGPHSADEEVVAVVETDMCAVDAIQYMTGCTLGKGNLIELEHGKNVYTFIRRSDGRALRIALRPGSRLHDPEHAELMTKVRDGTATDEERRRFRDLHHERSLALLDATEEELFETRDVTGMAVPPRASTHVSVRCAACGEATMETRIRRLAGRELCPPCFERALAGRSAPLPVTDQTSPAVA